MALIAPFVVRGRKNLVKIVAALLAVVCLVGSLSQTAKAETTYVITDGDAVKVHTTSASNPAKVLQEAGVNLDADDIYTTESVDGVSEIKIQRAMTVTVHCSGNTLHVNSYGERLDALFVRLGIVIDESMVCTLPLETMTYDGMMVTVEPRVETAESYTTEIPFETEYVDDPTLPLGEEKVLVAGKSGQKLCSANVTYVNGKEIQRNVYQETVTVEPVTRIVAKGTGEKVGQVSDQPLFGDGFIVLPTGEVLTYIRKDTFVATAYTHTDAGCDEITANGTRVKWGVVAVDPSVIPYGTRMFIVTKNGDFIYGLSTAEDCGGAIQNKRLDLYMETKEKCFQFGVRDCTVYFLGDANWKIS